MCDAKPRISAPLLAWYDDSARDLPWRVAPARSKKGERPDPYNVWLSEIMLQQTTVAAVGRYFAAFTRRWPDVASLAGANDAEVMAAWAGLGYYARARNLLKCARIIAGSGGRFPETSTGLQTLPGIGRYTAAAIAAIAFGARVAVVDGNVERVLARTFAVQTPLPKARPELMALAKAQTPLTRCGDYAQAMMDLGATICTPRQPVCPRCPLHSDCRAAAIGVAADLPRKAAKGPKPGRRGIAYVAWRKDGALLLERRPQFGLLGGMLGWPGGAWADPPVDTPPFAADWQVLQQEVRHTFTHFHLRLEVRIAGNVDDVAPEAAEFIPKAQFRPYDLPTVMRKVYDLVRQERVFDNAQDNV